MKYLLALFFSCSLYGSFAQLPIDSILHLDVNSLGGSMLYINSDSTYYISWSDCSSTDIAFGKWYVSKDTFIMKPATDTNWQVIRSFSYKPKVCNDTVYVSFIDNYGNPVNTNQLGFFDEKGNDIDEYNRYCGSELLVQSKKARYFYIYYYRFNKSAKEYIPILYNDIDVVFNPPSDMLDRGIEQVTTTAIKKYLIKSDGLYDLDNVWLIYR